MADSEPKTYVRGFNKRVFDPETSLRSADGTLDPLIKKQSAFLEENLDVDEKPFYCTNSAKCMCFVLLVPISIVLGLVVFKVDDSSSSYNCFVEDSCTGTTFYDPITGFTNDTGWGSMHSSSCCEICLPNTPTKVCFSNATDGSCIHKKGISGDFDYALFDQIWLPQYCNALSSGHDPTLSHLAGTTCDVNRVISNELIIHGLWPNYIGTIYVYVRV